MTTTSGIAWKIAGRVGDSPILGAGQYCDTTVGAAGSTGRGEANLKVCGAFLAVEFMRQGKSPEQALLQMMERVIAMTEPRLLDGRGGVSGRAPRGGRRGGRAGGRERVPVQARGAPE